MRKSRKKILIDPIFDDRVAYNFEVVAEILRVPVREVKRWKAEGLISYPVKEEEFQFLVAMTNVIWGNFHALRTQLARMSVPDRLSLVRTTDLTVFEREIFNFVLRWKLMFPRRYLNFSELRKIMQARYPNAFKQLNGKMLMRAKKAAQYEISKARINNETELLLKQLDLVIGEDGKIKSRAVIREAPITDNKIGLEAFF